MKRTTKTAAAPAKLTPAVRARIDELRRGGASLRETAATLAQEGVQVSHDTVDRATKAPPRRQAEPESSSVVTVMLEPPEGAPAPLVALYEAAQRATAHERATLVAVNSGDAKRSDYLAALKHVREALEDVLRLTPRAKPDPADDPTNVNLLQALRDTLTSQTEDAELRAGVLCPRCRGEVA